MIDIEGDIYVPEGTETDTRWIVPDEAVAVTAETLGLLGDGRLGIDPMCGVGTIPRVISKHGGVCHGVEVDPKQFIVARREIPEVVPVRLGDCTKIDYDSPYDYIYTSLPFSLFGPGVEETDDVCASVFHRMLKAPEGILIVDSTEETTRDGVTFAVAAAQIAYFKERGFKLTNRLDFHASAPGNEEVQPAELIFSAND